MTSRSKTLFRAWRLAEFSLGADHPITRLARARFAALAGLW
jgi:hypothetical protein